METTVSHLTIWFEDPFWVGVFERTCGGRLEAARVVFGAEPKDYEVYAYVLKNWSRLRFSPPVTQTEESDKHINPKRMQRAIHNQLSRTGIGTKAQQALKLQQEQSKQDRRVRQRQRSQEQDDRLFALRQQKRKDKHRGR